MTATTSPMRAHVPVRRASLRPLTDMYPSPRGIPPRASPVPGGHDEIRRYHWSLCAGWLHPRPPAASSPVTSAHRSSWPEYSRAPVDGRPRRPLLQRSGRMTNATYRPRLCHQMDRPVWSNRETGPNLLAEHCPACVVQRHRVACCRRLAAQERRPIVVKVAEVGGDVDRTHHDVA